MGIQESQFIGVKIALIVKKIGIAVLISATFLISSCQEHPRLRLNGDIGPYLYSTKLEKATVQQDEYFSLLCYQAGIADHSCENLNLEGTEWRIFLHTGLNDIDRRCDAYLGWINEVKDRGSLITSSLNATNSLIQGLLTIAAPNSSGAVAAFKYVAAAFGFTEDIFSKYQELVLSGIEHSTIATTVIKNRYDFRQAVSGLNIEFKPDVVHLLNSYLSICMPHTIKNNININATALVSNITKTPAFANPKNIGKTLVSNNYYVAEKSIKAEDIFGTKNTRSDKLKPNYSAVFHKGTYVEDDLEKMQRVFCLQGQGIGQVGSKTKASIQIFEEFKSYNGSFKIADSGVVYTISTGKITRDGKIDENENGFIQSLPDCDSSLYENIFERQAYPSTLKINGLARRIKLKVDNSGLTGEETKFNATFREAITKLRACYPDVSDFGGFSSDQMTLELDNKLQTNVACGL